MKIKTKKIVKISLILVFLIIFSFKNNVDAEESVTFPVNEAGISAYLKINEPGPEKLAKAIYLKDEIIEQEETHIIMSLKIDIEIKAETSENDINKKIYPLIYLNTDGWMVAYFPKEEESSKIMQWTNYSPGNLATNVLKEALIKTTQEIEATYSGEIKYYHFSYPDANKMTLVAETIHHPSQYENNFSVIVPGTIHEVSYFFYHSFRTNYTDHCYIKLLVDDVEIDSFSHSSCNGKGFKYGYYNSDTFKNNVAHLVSLSVLGRDDVYFEGGAATLFIYQI